MANKPYIVSYSKKHFEPRNIIYFLFGFELVELFLRLVFTLNFILFSYIEIFFREILFVVFFILNKIYLITYLIYFLYSYSFT